LARVAKSLSNLVELVGFGTDDLIVAKDGVCQFIALACLHLAASYVPKRSNSGLPGELPQTIFPAVHPAGAGAACLRRLSPPSRTAGCDFYRPCLRPIPARR
jgi:hypothetical protein